MHHIAKNYTNTHMHCHVMTQHPTQTQICKGSLLNVNYINIFNQIELVSPYIFFSGNKDSNAILNVQIFPLFS